MEENVTSGLVDEADEIVHEVGSESQEKAGRIGDGLCVVSAVTSSDPPINELASMREDLEEIDVKVAGGGFVLDCSFVFCNSAEEE